MSGEPHEGGAFSERRFGAEAFVTARKQMLLAEAPDFPRHVPGVSPESGRRGLTCFFASSAPVRFHRQAQTMKHGEDCRKDDV